MAVTVYRWDDTSAPSLVHGAGGILTILDAVLVNGYGSKVALGWSKPFGTSSNVTVYKQPAGTQQRLLRVDANGTAGNYYVAHMSSFETMTDMNTGTGKIPTTGQRSDGYCRWAITYSTSPLSPYRWIIIGDTSWFFLIVEMYTTSTGNDPFQQNLAWTTAAFYGDVADAFGSDAYATALTAATLDTGTNYYNYLMSASFTTSAGTQNPLFLHRPIAQTGTGALVRLQNLPNSVPDAVRYPNDRGKMFFSPYSLIDSYSDASALPAEYRGQPPALRIPWHSVTDLTNAGVSSLDTLSDGVDTYLFMWMKKQYNSGSMDPHLFKIT